MRRFARETDCHKTAKPIIFDRFSSHNKNLRFKSPIKFTPSYNEAGDLLVIDEPKYSLHVYAEDIGSLKAELEQAFGMMWQVFVAEGDRKLTAKAEKLRCVLKEEIVLEGESGL
jgi:ABC-type cobalamin transport system ATPase subunit